MKQLKTIILCVMIFFISYNLSPNVTIASPIPIIEEVKKATLYNVGLRKLDGTFRKFKTPEAGYNALVNDIEIKQSGRSKVIDSTATLEELINIYVPSFENNTVKYLNILMDKLCITKDTPITEINKHSLAKYILMLENKKVFNLLFGDAKLQE